MSWRQQALGGGLVALMIGLMPSGAVAQSVLTGTVLSGASLSGGAGGSARLLPGSRVTSPPRSWTEIVFSDGSSIVLGPGAELAVRQISSAPGEARNRISATGSGQIRIVAMDGMEVELTMPGAEVTVIAADAVLQAVPHGSVAMMGGHEVVVSQRSRRDTLRRPGFSVPLDGAGPQRDSDQQIVAALAPFASSGPSQSPSAAESAPPPATPAATRAQRARRGPTPAVSPSALVSAEIPVAGSTDLTTGLTAQSGSLTASPLLKIYAPALIGAIAPAMASVTAAIVPTSTISAPTPTPVVNPTVPDLNYSSYTPSPPVTAPGPAPVLNPTPDPTPQPSFITVDSALLAGISGTAGPITIPGTTTSVSAGLVPSNEHLTWGFFVPVGGSTTPATALANPYLTFLISSTALPNGSLQTLTGTATYVGGLIANTLGISGSLRQTGQFAQTWNFSTRSGVINVIYDGSTWRGVALTTLPVGLTGYSGAGTSTTDQRSITIQGGFYNSTAVSSGSVPGATGGTFYVGASSTGRPSAGGLFVGTRR